MKFLFASWFALFLALALPAAAADAPSTMLPAAFAGWQRSGQAQVTTLPAGADPIYASLLKEYGFESLHKATYEKPDRKLEIKAIRFHDASGAYGAFTFYKRPEMQTESIGDQGSSANTRVLFYRGNILVDVTLDRVTATSAGELRELASDLPLPPGPDRHPPILPAYLPKQYYIANTAKYLVGPAGLAAIGAPVSEDLVQFSQGAEIAVGQYHADWGVATLTLISYPTPQIAGDRLKAIDSSMPLQTTNRSPRTRVASKRSGPLVAVVTGDASPEDAKALLALVSFDADVTWNERVPNAKDNAGNLVLSVLVLTGIILGLALVAGVAFGGFRILVKKLYPNRVFDRPEDTEIIQLNLR
jgi:Family of unknown function (DUF6599)